MYSRFLDFTIKNAIVSNCPSTFSANRKPVFNNGPKGLPKDPPD